MEVWYSLWRKAGQVDPRCAKRCSISLRVGALVSRDRYRDRKIFPFAGNSICSENGWGHDQRSRYRNIAFACNLGREDGVRILSERLYSRQKRCSADVECDEIVWETCSFVDGRSRRIEY